MPTTIFPTWPHILFAILEPISLIAGWAQPIINLQSFITDQVPTSSSINTNTLNLQGQVSIPPTTTALAYQLANVYGLLALLGAGVLYSTSEPRVLRNYLVALAIADVGHVYVTYLAMGWDVFVDVGGWNLLTWGNVGVTAFLFFNRLAYLGGVFGFATSPSSSFPPPSPVGRGEKRD